MTNPICEKCMKAFNCINGRYCSHLGKYVEHDKVKAPCEDELVSNNQ